VKSGWELVFGARPFDLAKPELGDPVPKLLPPSISLNEGAQGEDMLRAKGCPLHAAATHALFDNGLAGRLGHSGPNGQTHQGLRIKNKKQL
jgi:hypothetical protein